MKDDLPETIRVDGFVDEVGIEFWGVATKQSNGKYHCFANVLGRLCLVEVTITFLDAHRLDAEVTQ